jgi:isopentenyldiphosphate isomerase
MSNLSLSTGIWICFVRKELDSQKSKMGCGEEYVLKITYLKKKNLKQDFKVAQIIFGPWKKR